MSHLSRRLGKSSWVAGILGCWLFCTTTSAAQLTIPNTFVPGTPAKAEQVNGNFAAVAAVVNANDQQLTDFLQSPAGGVVVKVGSTTIGPLFVVGPFSTVALTKTGFLVELAHGATEQFDDFVPFGVIPSVPTEGSLFPDKIQFTGPNCTGTPFVSVEPVYARLGVVVGNPANAQRGYYARGNVSPMSAQSFLILEEPNLNSGFLRSPSSARVGTPVCLADSEAIPLLGIPVTDNDPQVTGIPNNLSGPVTFTLAR